MSAPNIVNIEDLDYHEWEHAGRFAGRMGEIALKIGASKLGYNLTVIPPGKKAFPYHSHHVNEEMFFVLEGQGEFRSPAGRRAIGKGDFIACPAGGPETAHQIINTSEQDELKFLAVSTAIYPEICEFPDSAKYSVRHWFPSAETGEESTLRFVVKNQASDTEYWEGE